MNVMFRPCYNVIKVTGKLNILPQRARSKNSSSRPLEQFRQAGGVTAFCFPLRAAPALRCMSGGRGREGKDCDKALLTRALRHTEAKFIAVLTLDVNGVLCNARLKWDW